MNIAQSKTREQFPLSYKKIAKKTLTSSIKMIVGILFICIMAIWLLSVATLSAIGWILSVVVGLIIFMLLVMLLIYLYQRWYFAVYFYDLTADYIQIRKGPITPREITIPYERIQDVYMDQDIFDRMYGLYDVHLSSATGLSGMEAHIDGLERPAAEGLRAALLQIIQQRISKNKVVAAADNTQPTAAQQ